MKRILFLFRESNASAGNAIRSRSGNRAARAVVATTTTATVLYAANNDNDSIPASQNNTANDVLSQIPTRNQTKPTEPKLVKSKAKERLLVKLIREIASELGLEVETDSHDWIITLKDPKTLKTQHVMGYSFSLNSQVAAMLCDDKAALSTILTNNDIPNIEHKLFISPNIAEWTPESGPMRELFSYAEKFNYNVVIKPKDGSGGVGVTHCKNRRDVEKTALVLFSKNSSLVISPYEKIEHEFRVILLDGKPKFLFRKDRPSVTGDGDKTVKELLVERLIADPNAILDLLQRDNISKDLDLDRVVPKGQQLPILWKHNLGGGAKAGIDINKWEQFDILMLALRAAQIVGVRFASVDVVKVDGKLKIIEINSGVMMEKMPLFVTDGEALAKSIYKDAVMNMFDLNLVPMEVPRATAI